jgi:hypothetical protein
MNLLFRASGQKNRKMEAVDFVKTFASVYKK